MMLHRKKPIRALLLTWMFSDTYPGGESLLSWNQAVALARQGVEVFVLSPYVEVHGALPRGVHVYHLPFGKLDTGFSPENLLRAFLFGVPLILWKKINLVHVVTPGAVQSLFGVFKIRPLVQCFASPWDYADPRFAQDLAKDRREKPAMMKIRPTRTFTERIFRKIAFVLYKIFGLVSDAYQKGIDVWVCHDRKAARLIQSRLPESRTVVIPLGYDPDLFYPAERKTADAVFTFVSIASVISRRKGFQYLVPAFRKLHEEFPKTKLVLVGQILPSFVPELEQRGSVHPSIVFTGEVPPREAARLMRESDAFVLASLGEPFGMVLVESAASGLPIVATNAGGGPPDVVEEGKTGYLVEPASQDALYAGMKKLVQNPAHARAMGVYAAQAARQKYTWDTLEKRVVDEVYAKLVP